VFLFVRWYLKYSLFFRDLAEIMTERGLTLQTLLATESIFEYRFITLSRALIKEKVQKNQALRSFPDFIVRNFPSLQTPIAEFRFLLFDCL
jgi:hypothetical protein